MKNISRFISARVELMTDKWPNLQFPVQLFVEWPRWRAIASRFLILSIANFQTFLFQRKISLILCARSCAKKSSFEQMPKQYFLGNLCKWFDAEKVFFLVKFDSQAIEIRLRKWRREENYCKQKKNWMEKFILRILHKKFARNQFQPLSKSLAKLVKTPKKKAKTNSTEFCLFQTEKKRRKQNVLGEEFRVLRKRSRASWHFREWKLVRRKSEQLIFAADTIEFPWMSTSNQVCCCLSLTPAPHPCIFIYTQKERERRVTHGISATHCPTFRIAHLKIYTKVRRMETWHTRSFQHEPHRISFQKHTICSIHNKQQRLQQQERWFLVKMRVCSEAKKRVFSTFCVFSTFPFLQ